ncbi:unnamed protein product [marine sediment metagenome]|uniref:Uncharacterized protein n=1 Tax=marine sediment metagenome TaxID=412755 RepID=X1D671_9ZZZZ
MMYCQLKWAGPIFSDLRKNVEMFSFNSTPTTIIINNNRTFGTFENKMLIFFLLDKDNAIGEM